MASERIASWVGTGGPQGRDCLRGLVLSISLGMRLGCKGTCSLLSLSFLSFQLEFGDFLIYKYISPFLTPSLIVSLLVSFIEINFM